MDGHNHGSVGGGMGSQPHEDYRVRSGSSHEEHSWRGQRNARRGRLEIVAPSHHPTRRNALAAGAAIVLCNCTYIERGNRFLDRTSLVVTFAARAADGGEVGERRFVDSWTERDEHRLVYKFRLEAVEGEDDLTQLLSVRPAPRRIIPTAVKLEVWKRDGGKCVMCGATDDLHFDHDLAFSRGGTSLSTDNVQLLCARHNLAKSDSIV